MRLIDPWENIKVKIVNNKEIVQYFDNDIHMIYALAGEVTIAEENSFLTLQKDDFFICNKSKVYQLFAENSKIFILSMQYFFSNDDSNQYDHYFTGDSIKNTHNLDKQVIYLLNNLIELYIFREQKRTSEIFEVYFSLINLLEKKYLVRVKLDEERNLRKKIGEIKFYIDNNFDKEIKLSDLAGKLYVSEQYLSRLFSSEIGMSLSEYLIKKRLEKVRKDLFETEKSITDIVFSSGFSNINSFNRLFKKYQGMTPTEYRTESKKNVQVQSDPNGLSEEVLHDLQSFFNHEEESADFTLLEIEAKETVRADFNKYLINLGYAGDLLHSSYVRQVQAMQKNNFFKYGRIWGLFSNDIFEQVGTDFDFTNVDEIIQNILNAGMIPFLELGFKGKLIYETHLKTIKKESFEMNSNKLADILLRFTTFIEHCIDKFGKVEVSKWIIEIWKPNMLVLKTIAQEDLALVEIEGKVVNISTYDNYILFFSHIKKRIAKILPEIQVGGCGLSLDIERGNLQEFFRKWNRSTGRPDFISIGIYPMDEIKYEFFSEQRQNPISPDEDYMFKRIQEVHELMQEEVFDCKLYVTEFNVTILNRDIINDTAFKGVYIIKNILSILDYCELIGYWQLSDFTVTTFDTSKKEIFGGTGLLSKNGIPKIGYFAFKFLKMLGDQLIYESDNLLVTRRENSIQILGYLYSHLNATYYYETQGGFHKNNAYAIFDNDKPIKIKLDLRTIGLQTQKVLIKKYSIGKNQGNFLEEANTLSSSDNFDKESIEYLKKRCTPNLETQIKDLQADYLLDIHLTPYDIEFYEIREITAL